MRRAVDGVLERDLSEIPLILRGFLGRRGGGNFVDEGGSGGAIEASLCEN